MNWIYYVLIIFFVLLFLLVITKITVTISYQHNGDDDLLKVKVKAWKFLTYTFSAPLIKVDKNTASIIVQEDQTVGGVESEKKVKITVDEMIEAFRKIKDHLRHIVGFHRIVRSFLKHISVQKFEWRSNLGVSDASYTGFVTGVAWTIKGSIVGLIGNYMKLHQKPIIMINPHFQTFVSQTDLQCMISFRVGYAMKAGLLIVKHWKRRPSPLRTTQENV